MKLLYNWLKEFVDVKLAPRELAERLSLAGVAVDSVEDSPAGPVFDAEIVSNRPDLLGHAGVAREVAAILRSSLRTAAPAVKESADRTDAAVRVEISCPDLCGRYAARVVRGVKVQPSPDWLRQRLEALGQTSINNVVDVTNYVMLETGKPVHAFDFDTIDGRRIEVRRARAGEKLRTLDGVERALTAEMCMIADALRAVALGGIIGGAETEIGSLTRNVLIESAWFDPIAIRRTAKALGLRTEASIRFERRADSEMVVPAATRTAELIQQLAGGEVLAGVVDICPMQHTEQPLELSRREILRVMGADVPDAEIEAILRALGFEPMRVDGNRGSRDSLVAVWKCRQASWRADVTREIDLVEEVARHYGFDKFPPRLPPAKQPAARLPHAAAEDRLRERLVALGYQEIVAIPLVDEAHDAVFRASGVTPAKISNPLAEDASLLRSSGLVNMLHTLEWNLNRGQRNLRLFEIGRAYALEGATATETPIVTLGVTGQAREKNLYEAPRAFGFEDLLGDLEVLGEDAGGLKPLAGSPAWLHPARSARIALPDGKPAGVAGQLAHRVAEQFKLKHAVYVAELELEPLYEARAEQLAARRYRPLSRFPAVERDFSLLLDDRVTFATVREAIAALRILEIEQIDAVDLFRGGSVPAGKHSLLVRVALQSYEATLTDAQVNEISGRIVAALEKQLGAVLRTA